MRAFYCDQFVLPLPDGHRFPMEKYRLLREAVARTGRIALAVPDRATSEEVLRVHTEDYWVRVRDGALTREEVRRIGFPWTAQLVERSRRSVGGTISAARAALEDGVSANLAGGTHHAFADRGEGFCVFNDVAVAVRAMQAEGRIRRASVVDLDVHQGNGTAAIFADDDDVFTTSVHGESNYPFHKERSDLDLPLPDGCKDPDYLAAVEEAVAAAIASSPDIVFYVAGADPHAGDRLGRLAVSRAGLSRRDDLVFEAASHAGIPVAVVMAGGYGEAVIDTVDIHASTVLRAAEVIPADDVLPADDDPGAVTATARGTA